MSGIYIEGMGLPDNDEVIALFVYPNGDVRLWRPPSAIGQQYTAVPVADHGRLIDADEIPYNKIMLEDDEFYYGVTMPYIDRMPTIIPASKEGEG